MKTAITILLNQQAPKETRKEYKPVPLKKKVEECIRRVESNQIDSEREWTYLKRLYEGLSRKPKLNEEQEDIIEALEDLFEKYSNHDHEDSVDLDAQYMNRPESRNRGED